MSFSALVWAFKLLPSIHAETGIWCAAPFISTFRDLHGEGLISWNMD